MLHRSSLESLQMNLHQKSWGGSKFFSGGMKGEFSCCHKRKWECQQGIAWHLLGRAGLQAKWAGDGTVLQKSHLWPSVQPQRYHSQLLGHIIRSHSTAYRARFFAPGLRNSALQSAPRAGSASRTCRSIYRKEGNICFNWTDRKSFVWQPVGKEKSWLQTFSV